MSTENTAQRTAAAHFVERHLDLFTAYSRTNTLRPGFADPDEFRADLVEDALLAHHTFRVSNDPRKKVCKRCGERGCSTWLWWRARGVRTNYFRHWERANDQVPIEDYTALPATLGNPARMFAQAQVQQLLDRAHPDHRAALVSKLEEWDGVDVWNRLGIGMGGRNYRLERFRLTLQGDPEDTR